MNIEDYVHIAREQITVTNAVKTLTAATIIARVRYADIQVLTADVRKTDDGTTAPVGATTGMVWYATKTYRVWGVQNLLDLIFIRDGANPAVLVVEYWGIKAS